MKYFLKINSWSLNVTKIDINRQFETLKSVSWNKIVQYFINRHNIKIFSETSNQGNSIVFSETLKFLENKHFLCQITVYSILMTIFNSYLQQSFQNKNISADDVIVQMVLIKFNSKFPENFNKYNLTIIIYNHANLYMNFV